MSKLQCPILLIRGWWLTVQVLILFAALSTCDPGNVMDAVKTAKEKNVHVSIVGMAAEVRICAVFTKVTALPPLLPLVSFFSAQDLQTMLVCPRSLWCATSASSTLSNF